MSKSKLDKLIFPTAAFIVYPQYLQWYSGLVFKTRWFTNVNISEWEEAWELFEEHNNNDDGNEKEEDEPQANLTNTNNTADTDINMILTQIQTNTKTETEMIVTITILI